MRLDLKNYKNRHSFKSKARRAVWNLVWTLFGKWTPDHFRMFNIWRVFLLRLFGAKIGKGCVIKSSCEIWQPWNLTMGDYATLSEHVVCYTVDKILIGDQTTISREVFLCCASHDVRSPIMELTQAPIVIGACVWIAARAIVMPGRNIGDGVVVAAGSVVIDNAKPWTIIGGNPAKYISIRELKEM